MTFSFWLVALVCFIYLSLIFTIAYITEHGWVSEKIVSHPITYIFSLGIFASAWSFYGVIELARQFGYGALSYYLGTGVMFLFAPLVLKPLIELGRRYQITSIADLLTFRYDSHAVGGMVTICMIFAMAPLLALQIKALADTIYILIEFQGGKDPGAHNYTSQKHWLAFIFCLVIACFSILFGAKRNEYKGLITAMAFESLIKVLGLVAVGLYAVIKVFDGLHGLDDWLLANPEHLERLYRPIEEGSAHTLLLVFIATAVAMPHIFHISVIKSPLTRSLKTVSWAFPLFLMVMAFPIFPILWAGIAVESDLPAQYYPLAIPLAENNRTITLIAFIGGLSAATGAIIAISLALAMMMLNHLILPHMPLRSKNHITNRLTILNRLMIGLVILLGFLFYRFLDSSFNLTELALVAFIATLQLLPGVLSVAHWTQGNRNGFIAGLTTGIGIWAMGLFLPLIMGYHSITPLPMIPQLSVGVDHWNSVTVWSLTLNTIAFVLVSYLSRVSDSEKYSANLCSKDELSHPIRLTLDANSPDDFIERLSLRMGETTARREVEAAMQTLGLNTNEKRPFALRRLRDELEANLSGLMGISMASEIMDNEIPFVFPDSSGPTDINLIESRLNEVKNEFTGLTAELNELRLYHRQTLEELPMAACAIGTDKEILMWNHAMGKLTGIAAHSIVGSGLHAAPEPWGTLLMDFANSRLAHDYKREIQFNDRPHWITLHKASIPSPMAKNIDGQVMLLEDVTETQRLEQEVLHTERLASIGRLAAGVAHEIGNPVTGIACLAQNLKYETEEKEVLEASEQILSQTNRVTRIVQSLVSFSHAGQHVDTETGAVSLYACAEEAIHLLKLQKEQKQVEMINLIPETLTIKGDSQRLIQVFINLLSNARDASDSGQAVTLEGLEKNRSVEITVTDKGSGIPLNVQDRIMEPFFTTKEPGKGTGLGLAMVYSILEDHHGKVNIISPINRQLGRGTQIRLYFPVYAKK